MATLVRRLGGLAQTLRLSSRQLTLQQGAALHLSAAVEARRRKDESDSDSDEDANPSPPGAHSKPEVAEEWPPRIDQSQLRALDGSVPQEPMEQLVAQPSGRWDVNTLVSPALAAALEAAPARSVEEADAIFQELHDALEALHKGKTLPDDAPASDDDLRRVAEAIELYFQAAPDADFEADSLEEFDREMLDTLAKTIREVLDGGARSNTLNVAPAGRLPWEVLDVDEDKPMINWGVDLTEGKAADPWKNALLSEDAKEAMWAMHKQEGWSAEALAQHFGVRPQRALAILALKEKEHAARAAGLPLHTDLAAAFEEAFEAHESMGAREAHHVVLPSYPNYTTLSEADADRLAALLEARLGKSFDDIELGDMTPEVTQELLAAAGASKEAIEAQLAATEESHAVREFAAALQYNLGKSGAGLSRSSRKRHPPARPPGGWGLLVQPLGKAKAPAYVAQPGGCRRELTEDEKLQLERRQPKPRHRVL